MTFAVCRSKGLNTVHETVQQKSVKCILHAKQTPSSHCQTQHCMITSFEMRDHLRQYRIAHPHGDCETSKHTLQTYHRCLWVTVYQSSSSKTSPRGSKVENSVDSNQLREAMGIVPSMPQQGTQFGAVDQPCSKVSCLLYYMLSLCIRAYTHEHKAEKCPLSCCRSSSCPQRHDCSCHLNLMDWSEKDHYSQNDRVKDTGSFMD